MYAFSSKNVAAVKITDSSLFQIIKWETFQFMLRPC